MFFGVKISKKSVKCEIAAAENYEIFRGLLNPFLKLLRKGEIKGVTFRIFDDIR